MTYTYDALYRLLTATGRELLGIQHLQSKIFFTIHLRRPAMRCKNTIILIHMMYWEICFPIRGGRMYMMKITIDY